MNFAMMAFAGVVGNRRLLQIVERVSPSRMAARRALAAWLAGNLFLGSQIAWNLRPLVGTPGLPIEFMRPDAFRCGFLEPLCHSFVSTSGN